MPEWRETAPPEFQQLSPTNKITFESSPTKEVTAPVVPVKNNVIPSPGGSTAGCAPEDFPAAIAGAISLIQRGTCAFVQKLSNAMAAGAVGVILFNEGNTAGRMNALFRSGPTDQTTSARERADVRST